MIRAFSRKGMEQYDLLPPEKAVVAAWSDAGPLSQDHYALQAYIRRVAPVLARALDRLAYGEVNMVRWDNAKVYRNR